MSRTDKILSKVPRHGLGIEIGPGYNPLVPKSEGWNTLVVDHASQAELIEKYRKIGVDPSRIQETDIIWHGGPLHEALPAEKHGTFDYCVASHVIEHIPNPIAFLLSLSTLLKKGGVIALAIPDKRYCFDFFQPITCTADILTAFHRDARVHSPRAIFQHRAYTVRGRNGKTTWSAQLGPGPLEFFAPDLGQVYSGFIKAMEAQELPYEDCHAWHFTPSSFRLIHLELSQLGLLPLSLVEHHPSDGCEFFVTLGNTPPSPLTLEEFRAARLALLQEIVREQAQQWELQNSRYLPQLRDLLVAFLRYLGVLPAIRRLREIIG